jgi:DNA-binding phage protein
MNWQEIIIELKQIAEAKDMTQMEMQARTGLLQSTISRFFDLKYKSNLETVGKVANALGYELVLKKIDS